MRPFLIAVATAVALSAACADSVSQQVESPAEVTIREGSYAYVAFSPGGKRVLEGTIDLFLGTDSVASGVWEIRWAAGADSTITVGPQVGLGTAIGYKTAEGLVLDLNPRWADNNVLLRSVVAGDDRTLEGRWTYSGFPGPLAEGKFSITRIE